MWQPAAQQLGQSWGHTAGHKGAGQWRQSAADPFRTPPLSWPWAPAPAELQHTSLVLLTPERIR